ncbi:MAG: PEP-CTERM sorting domain-containing protein [Verrucomicrobia bacterium]|nr:PEP-CTERM sorting domain-containing protein [Verrucomicrobiota bacterium]
MAASVTAAAVMAGTSAKAAVLAVTTDDAFSINSTITWTPAGAFEFYNYSDEWSISVSFVPAGGVNVIAGSMAHVKAPHAGEVAPNTPWNFAFVVPPTPANAGAVLGHAVGPHSDSFSATISGGPASYTLVLDGRHPIPEPAHFALLGGLGLLGFGAYRRFRRA